MVPTLTRRFQVHGHVQGVGFRWWTRSLALQHQIRGTVRNLPDGSVEVIAAGEEEALHDFRSLLHTGPPGARVSVVDEQETDISDSLRDFQIVG